MIVLLLLLLLSVYYDLRTFRIPNAIILAGLGSGILFHTLFLVQKLTHYELPFADVLFWHLFDSILLSLLTMVLVFLFLIPLHQLKIIGGGDIKLFSVCGLFTGPDKVVTIIIYSFLAGAVLSLCHLLIIHIRKLHSDKEAQNQSHQFFYKKLSTKFHKIHFSIPIVIGVVMELIWGRFF